MPELISLKQFRRLNKPISYDLMAVAFSAMFLLTTFNTVHARGIEKNIAVDGETEIGLHVYPSQGDTLVIWVAPGFGLKSRHRELASTLGKHSMEIWQVDLLEALFLDRGARSMRTLSGEYVQKLIQHAVKTTTKNVILMGNYYSSLPVLRGAREWQRKAPGQSRLRGIVLFDPSPFTDVPQLGLAPEYAPIVAQTNLPVFIFQSEKNANRWFVDQTSRQLARGGAQVFLHIMPDVTSLFYSADEKPATLRKLREIPINIDRAVNLLEKMSLPANAANAVETTTPRQPTGGINSGLVAFKGSAVPPAIDLMDVNGQRFVMNDFRGKLRLINFWATWCPPCVEEIPSLNRLRKAMDGKPFEIISINYAENPQQIHKFMRRVKVDFPVLLDSNGRVAAQWQVFAFPSTFVIDANGKVRYGVNAAIHWDSTEVLHTLETLLPTSGYVQLP